MISRQLLATGRARGHDIRIAAVRPRSNQLHAQPDLSLLIDVFNHAHSLRSLGAWRGFDPRFLDRVMGQAPFVHLTNAYVDVCNLPYLPCSGTRGGGPCPVKPLDPVRQMLLRDRSRECFARDPAVNRLYTGAALNVYLSPLHQRVSESLLEGRHAPGYVLRPMIDTKRFHNRGLARDIEYLFVGVIGEAKGLDALRERFRDADIHFIGRCAAGVKLDFGCHLGHVPYDEVPDYMNRARHFVFLPRWPEPQGRVVAEAALCGCAVIGNERVGALSFDFDLADPARYVGVEDEFWSTLENLPR